MADSKKAKRVSDTAVANKNEKKAELKVAETKKSELKKVDVKAKEQEVPASTDKLLWLTSLVLLIAAIGGNYYFTQFVLIDESSFARLGRVAIVIALILGALAVLLFTNKGRKIVSFARESYVELRKVVWPTRQEALQTTFIVFIAVSVVSLFLYLCDLIFLQIVRFITL